jgi:hypothetical protein
MDTTLDREVTLEARQIIRTKSAKPGDEGRHEVPGMRRYTVMRFGRRDQFVFSTVSIFVLSLMGAIHVDPFGLRPDWSRYTAAEA